MDWYKTAVNTKGGFSTEDISVLSRKQLLNLVSMEILDDNPDRDKIWTAINSLISMLDRYNFRVGDSVMEKVDYILNNPNYPERSFRLWPTDEAKQADRQRALDLLREIMMEFL